MLLLGELNSARVFHALVLGRVSVLPVHLVISQDLVQHVIVTQLVEIASPETILAFGELLLWTHRRIAVHVVALVHVFYSYFVGFSLRNVLPVRVERSVVILEREGRLLFLLFVDDGRGVVGCFIGGLLEDTLLADVGHAVLVVVVDPPAVGSRDEVRPDARPNLSPDVVSSPLLDLLHSTVGKLLAHSKVLHNCERPNHNLPIVLSSAIGARAVVPALLLVLFADLLLDLRHEQGLFH